MIHGVMDMMTLVADSYEFQPEEMERHESRIWEFVWLDLIN